MHDPFGRSRLPSDFSREGRLRMLAAVFEALLRGEPPPPESARFVGAAGCAWLAEGGPLGALERDFLRVTGPRRSTVTPARLWQRLQGSTGRATPDANAGTMDHIDNSADPDD